MGLFFSGSKKSNTTNTNKTTNNSGYFDASVGGEINAHTVGAAGGDVNILDGGAISDAFDFATGINEDISQTIDNVLSFTGEATSAFINAVTDNNQSSNATIDNALEFSAGAIAANNNTLLQNLDFLDGESDEAREFEAGLIGSVLGLASENVNRAYADINDTKQFAAGLTGKVLDDSKDSYERNLAAVQSSHNNSMSFASGAFSSAVNNITQTADKGFKFLKDSSLAVLGGMAEFTTENTENMQENNLAALDAIEESSKSASEETNDMMFKVALGLVGVVGLGVAVAAWRKRT